MSAAHRVLIEIEGFEPELPDATARSIPVSGGVQELPRGSDDLIRAPRLQWWTLTRHGRRHIKSLTRRSWLLQKEKSK